MGGATTTPADSPAPVDANRAAATPDINAAALGAAGTQNIAEAQRNDLVKRDPAAQIAAVARTNAAMQTTAAAKTNAAAPITAGTNNTAAAQAGASETNAAPVGTGDVTTQTIMAAAALQGGGAVTSDPSATADEEAAPDVAAVSQDAAIANAAAAPAVAPAPLPPASAAAVKALSTVQQDSALVGAATLDRHAHVAAPDLSLSGASIDSAGAAQSGSGASTSTVAAPAPTLNVSAGVDSPEFGQGVADRVSLMVDSNLSSAKLQVNPPALGPIEVRIALQAGHAQVWLTSHSAVTRDALESSSPKLREMLGAQGFAHVSVDISQRSFQDRTPQSRGYEAMPAVEGEGIGATPAAIVSASRAVNSLLDTYA
jgi:flagellar hook-length control protein FliK